MRWLDPASPIVSKIDHPLVAGSLVLAGMPTWFDVPHLSLLYWLFVLPGAATSFTLWCVKYIPAARWLATKIKTWLQP